MKSLLVLACLIRRACSTAPQDDHLSSVRISDRHIHFLQKQASRK